MVATSPGLFGLNNSNRDFSQRRSWGKNIFNNAFPVALTCYFRQLKIEPVYLTLNDRAEVQHGYINVDRVFGIDPAIHTTFFAFESDFAPFRTLVTDNLPGADLVVQDDTDGTCKSSLEIKLTALPDNSTHDRLDDEFGCELVVRPGTIVYLALNIASHYRDDRSALVTHLSHLPDIDDWTNITAIAPAIPDMADALDDLLVSNLDLQTPLVLQPVWKTQGQKLLLQDNAFDVFVWSDFAFTRLFFRDRHRSNHRLTPGARTIAWLAKMLLDFSRTGKINYRHVIDAMSYNTMNDKAFAVNGKVTQPFMASPELTKPRLKKDILKDVILGGGENYLSPERRLDAAILSTPDLFE